MSKHNLALLIEAAHLLEPLLGELVFVGGSTTALLITDKAAADVRPTYDVDAIAEITSYAAYAEFSERLRKLGFTEDTSEGAAICRWRQKKTILDVMPLDEKILGFSNRWYKPAMDSAVARELEPGLRVRVVTGLFFCATKLEAFAGRGKNDYLASHDLEDLVSVVDGRAELVEEIHAGPEDVRTYIASELTKLLAIGLFVDTLPGYLLPDAASQARISTVVERLKQIAGV
ncbi:MAG: hypothetical protein ACLP9L_22915 [Thermoguttaceae bacterium]